MGAPLGKGTLGFAFSGFYTSELEGRDDVGNLTQGFGFNDITMTAAYGRPIAAGLDAGLAVRYLREMIADIDAATLRSTWAPSTASATPGSRSAPPSRTSAASRRWTRSRSSSR